MKCEKHKGMVNMTLVEFPVDNCPHCKLNASQDEVARLTRCLKIANANHEEFERRYYLETHKSEKAEERELERVSERLAWLADKYQIDCSGLDSGDLLDGVEHTIQCALKLEKKARNSNEEKE